MPGRILEITFVLIVIFLVATNASGFSQVVRAVSSAYTENVKALQGR